MKTGIFRKLCSVVALIAIVGGFTACDNAEYATIDNAIYISEASKDMLQKVTVDDSGGSASVSVRTNQKSSQNIVAQIGVDDVLLKNYNQKMGTQYEILPTKYYELSSRNANIIAGNSTANSIVITIKPLPEDITSSGKKYAIPISIIGVDGDMTILENAKGVIYALDQVIVTSAPVFGRVDGKQIVGLFHMREEDYNLNVWSFEMRVNMSYLGENDVIGSAQNQSFWQVSIPEGYTQSDGEIFMRFGAANLLGNTLQVKLKGGNPQVEANTSFNPNEWYHLAFVNDGSKLSIYVDGELDISIDHSGDNFHFGGIFKIGATVKYFISELMMSEVRFWTKAISQQQIKDNMFAVDPQSEGLEAYWKLNEGEGNIFYDATGHGNDGDIENNYDIIWKHGIRSDEK